MSAALQDRTLLCVLPPSMQEDFFSQAVKRKSDTYQCQADIAHEGGHCYLLRMVGDEQAMERVVESLKDTVCGFGGRMSDFEPDQTVSRPAFKP